MLRESSVIAKKLDRIAVYLKLKSRKYTDESMEVDRVWYLEVPMVGEVPVLGFEIEASPKPIKYYKGDLNNLHALGCWGVIVLSDKGFSDELEPTRKKLLKLVQTQRFPVKILAESDLDQIIDVLGA